MKKIVTLTLSLFCLTTTLSAEKMSLQRAVKFYNAKDFERAEKEILRAIEPPYASMEEWAKILNYHFLIKADLYCNEESIFENLHELSSLSNTYMKCRKVDAQNIYMPELTSKMESIGSILLGKTETELANKHYDTYLTKMDQYILLADVLGKDNTLHYKKLAEVSVEAEHPGRALHYWHKMIQTGFEVEHAYKEMLALLYDMELYDKVDEMLLEAKNAYPDNSHITEIEILRMIDADLIFGAKKLAEKTAQKDPSNPNIVFLVGLLNSKLKNNEDAIESFLAVADLDATHFDTHVELGRYFLSNSNEEGNLALAKHYLEKAERIKPKDSTLTVLLLDTYSKLSQAKRTQEGFASTTK